MCPKNIKDIKIKKILVIGSDSLARNLLLTPSIKKIKEAFREAEMDIVAGPSAVEFAAEHPFFRSYIPYSIRNPFMFLKKARKRRYDLIVSFGSGRLMPYFLRGKYRLSFFWKYFFSDKNFTMESDLALNFIEPFFGRDDAPRVFFPVTARDRDSAAERLKNDGVKSSERFIVIAPGADAGRKPWPAEKFAKAAKELMEIYGTTVILAGPEKSRRYSEKIKALIGGGHVYNYSGAGMKETAALMDRADLLITGSLDYMHLAGAAKCPVVAIFGPGNPYRYGPVGTKNIVVHSNLECFPCRAKKYCRRNFLCLEKIKPEQVLKAAMLIMDEKEQPLLFNL
ncbi:MAG: glycosyltransferase family 9 protein [Candidatus Omnitrophica bacterium]|nr:glycosyltransferase family 9 protein [Candidatus Omnitrophota bacterium]